MKRILTKLFYTVVMAVFVMVMLTYNIHMGDIAITLLCFLNADRLYEKAHEEE